MLVSCLAFSSTLKMETACSFEMSVDFQRITWRYILEGRTLHNHHCENLRSYIYLKATRNFPTEAAGTSSHPTFSCMQLSVYPADSSDVTMMSHLRQATPVACCSSNCKPSWWVHMSWLSNERGLQLQETIHPRSTMHIAAQKHLISLARL
jgi:hypothetical protein